MARARSRSGWFTLAAAAALSASAADAAVITLTTADGMGADTYVRGGSFSSTAFGGDAFFAAKTQLDTNGDNNYEDSFTRVSFLRFDLSAVAGTIQSATLRIETRGFEAPQATVYVGAMADGHDLDAAPGSGGWVETGIGALTMDQALAEGAIPAFHAHPRTVNAVGLIVSWTDGLVLSALQDDTNDLITFSITAEGGLTNTARGANFWSKENIEDGMFPTLEVTFTPSAVAMPEPIGGGLLVAVSWFAGRAFRRVRRRAP
jgi:hypothetical protein